MKILVLSPKPPWPSHDGGAVATMRCIEGLAENGAEVTLLAIKTEKHWLYPESDYPWPACLSNYTYVNINTRIRPLKLMYNLLLSDQPYDLERFHSGLFSDALSHLPADFDIIQCEGLLFTLYLDEIRRLTSSPVILRAHNVEHRIRSMMAENSGNPLSRTYLRNLALRLQNTEINAARQFDAVVPICEPDSDWFRSVAPDKPVFMSGTGTVNAEYIEEPAGPTLKVGFIGSLNWQPNLHGIGWFIDKVWPQVLQAVPSATLHIAGKGATARTKRLISGERVSFEGEVDDAQAFMASMNVIIAPLFAGSGLRIKIIEAMSVGRSVVASPVAASGLPVVDRREIFIADNPVSFVTTLKELLENPFMRSSAGKAAVKLIADRFDNRVLTAGLLEFYRKLIHGR